MSYRTVSLPKHELPSHMARFHVDHDSFMADVQNQIDVDGKPNKAFLARKYGITRNTVYGWLSILLGE